MFLRCASRLGEAIQYVVLEIDREHVGGCILPLEEPRGHQIQELRLQATRCSFAHSVLSKFCDCHTPTTRYIRRSWIFLPRPARKRQATNVYPPSRSTLLVHDVPLFLCQSGATITLRCVGFISS